MKAPRLSGALFFNPMMKLEIPCNWLPMSFKVLVSLYYQVLAKADGVSLVAISGLSGGSQSLELFHAVPEC